MEGGFMLDRSLHHVQGEPLGRRYLVLCVVYCFRSKTYYEVIKAVSSPKASRRGDDVLKYLKYCI